MAAPKNLLKTLIVDHAKARHRCKHSAKHVIFKGDQRLTVKVGRKQERYCTACAQQFIGSAIEQLQRVLTELDIPKVS
jgi:glucose/arabinose dehydrogenase